MKTSISNIKVSRLIIGILLALVGLVAMLCISPYFLLGYGCFWWECAPHRDFTVYELSIPSELLPLNAQPIMLRPSRGTIGAVEEVSGESQGFAVYIVNRFNGIKRAEKWYDGRVASARFTNPLFDTKAVSVLLNFKSKTADQYNVACGYLSEELRCVFEARYQEYYIFFRGIIREERLTQDHFYSIISYIDQKIGVLLQSSE